MVKFCEMFLSMMQCAQSGVSFKMAAATTNGIEPPPKFLPAAGPHRFRRMSGDHWSRLIMML